jgi:hypothetical protein
MGAAVCADDFSLYPKPTWFRQPSAAHQGSRGDGLRVKPAKTIRSVMPDAIRHPGSWMHGLPATPAKTIGVVMPDTRSGMQTLGDPG